MYGDKVLSEEQMRGKNENDRITDAFASLFSYVFKFTLTGLLLTFCFGFSGRACTGMVSKAMCGEVPL